MLEYLMFLYYAILKVPNFWRSPQLVYMHPRLKKKKIPYVHLHHYFLSHSI